MMKLAIGLTTFSILISITSGLMFANMENKLEKSKLLLKFGWLWLLMLQGVYLSLDIAESVTENVLYGIIASAFMIGLGVFILTLTLLEKLHSGELEVHGIIEGVFYLFFGIALLVIRMKNKAKEDAEEEEEKYK